MLLHVFYEHFVCFSTGVWNATERSLKLYLAKDFVFFSNKAAANMPDTPSHGDQYYILYFNERLSFAKLRLGSHNFPRHLSIMAQNLFMTLPMIESRRGKYERGEKFHRFSLAGPVPVNYYYILRVLRRDGTVSERNTKKVMGHFSTRIKKLLSGNNFGTYKAPLICS